MGATANVARYFTAFVSFKQAQAVLGSFKFCTAKIEPKFSERKVSAVQGEAKGKKEEKGGKKEGNNNKNQGGKKGKQEADPEKDAAKLAKEAKEKARQDALEAELKAHDDRVKKWLEMEGKFDFEEFKRTYCNAQPNEFKPV
jgi:polygalacturonase